MGSSLQTTRKMEYKKKEEKGDTKELQWELQWFVKTKRTKNKKNLIS